MPTPDPVSSAPRTAESDAALVVRARAGDAAAFDLLARRHYRTAFAIALARMRSRADAEDVCHDAFMRAAERLDQCRNPERFSAWLCMIVRNRARNAQAKAFVRRSLALEHHTAASTDNPDRSLQLAELRGRLLRALGELTTVQREVVLLHDLDGLSHEEAASIVGTSPGMSRQHLFKARRRLRELLHDLIDRHPERRVNDELGNDT
jgi:RNA polymerase sigma-70 factor (ECF subfamily)